MKIAMISEHASPLAALGGVDAGGQNVYVAELARRLVERGFEVRVYTRRDRQDLPERVVTTEGVEVIHLDAGPLREIPKDQIFDHLGAFADRLLAHFMQSPPDLIHAHFWMSGLAAIDARRRCGIGAPIVQIFHALGQVKRRHQPAEDTSPDQRVSLERYIAENVDAIVATCSDEVRELRDLHASRDRIHVIPCGVDIQRFRPVPSVERSPQGRVLSIGRLVPRKGVDTLIRAIALLPGVQLQIAGGASSNWANDPDVLRLRALAETLSIAGRVHFLGPIEREQVPHLISACDVVATLPWYEPFGLVPLEAMACGVPVVASAVGGMLDTVVSGATGLLVPPEDHTTAAAAIGRLLAHPAQARSMGQAGIARVRERYTWDVVVDQTSALYASLLTPRTPARVIDLRAVSPLSSEVSRA